MAENRAVTVDEHQDQAVRDSEVRVPAAAIELLRDGLRSQLSVAAQHIANADGQLDAREHPERYQTPLREIDSFRALLEVFGWNTPPENYLGVGLGTHGWALMEALREQISIHADLLRDTQDDQVRETLARNMDALTPLALDVLLRTQADIRLTTTLEASSV
jgi:hypothetical protein